MPSTDPQPIWQPLQLRQGETLDLARFAIDAALGDLTGASATLVIRAAPDATSALLATATSATGGLVLDAAARTIAPTVVGLSPATTSAWPAGGYWHEATVTLATGAVHVVAYGRVTVLARLPSSGATAGLFLFGTLAQRPLPAAASGYGYYATDVRAAWLSDGTSWYPLNSAGSRITELTLTTTAATRLTTIAAAVKTVTMAIAATASARTSSMALVDTPVPASVQLAQAQGGWEIHDARTVDLDGTYDTVAVWPDQGTGALDWDMLSDGAQQPVWTADAGDGKPAILFDSIGTFLRRAAYLASATQAEILMVLSLTEDPPALAANGGIWTMGYQGDSSYYVFVDGSIFEGWGTSARKDSVGNPATPLTATHIYNVSSAAGAFSARIYAATPHTYGPVANTVFFPSTGDYSIGRAGGGALQMRGKIRAMYIRTTTLSTSDRNALVAQLKTEWGIA